MLFFFGYNDIFDANFLAQKTLEINYEVQNWLCYVDS